jgi:hypothetical protein
MKRKSGEDDADRSTVPKASLSRLLRAAALQNEPASREMPFGFDTRVVAQWHGQAEATSLGVRQLLRRVALTSAAIIVLASAGTYIQTERNAEDEEPFTNDFAIADATIQEEAGL